MARGLWILGALFLAHRTCAFVPPRPLAARARVPACFAGAANVEVTPGMNSSAVIKLRVAGADTKAAYNQAAKSYAQSVQVDGFQKGKVPMKILEARVGKAALFSGAMETIAETVVSDAIKQSGVQAIGQAALLTPEEVILSSFKPGEPLELELRVDVWPEVEFMGTYEGNTIEAERPRYNETAAALAMKSLRERYVTLSETPAGTAAGEGSALIVNMDGFAYDASQPGNKGEALPLVAEGQSIELVLEKDRFMPGLVEALNGVTAGETRNVEVEFPDRATAGPMRGQKAVFQVEVLEVKERQLPSLDDAFANQIREGLTFEDLEREVNLAVNEDAEAASKQQLGKALDEMLVNCVKCEVPETLVEERAREAWATMLADFRDQGMADEDIQAQITRENFLKYKEVARPRVEKELKTSFAHGKLSELHDLKVDPSAVNDQMEIMRMQATKEARQQGKAEPDFDEGRTRERVEVTLMAEQIHDFLKERNDVVYVDGAPGGTPSAPASDAKPTPPAAASAPTAEG